MHKVLSPDNVITFYFGFFCHHSSCTVVVPAITAIVSYLRPSTTLVIPYLYITIFKSYFSFIIISHNFHALWSFSVSIVHIVIYLFISNIIFHLRGMHIETQYELWYVIVVNYVLYTVNILLTCWLISHTFLKLLQI